MNDLVYEYNLFRKIDPNICLEKRVQIGANRFYIVLQNEMFTVYHNDNIMNKMPIGGVDSKFITDVGEKMYKTIYEQQKRN